MKSRVYLFLGLFMSVALSVAHGQQKPNSMPRIGLILSTGSPETPSPLLDAFRQGLQDLGYSDEKNIVIERRYAEGRIDKMSPFVQEFVQQKVDVIIGVNNVVIRAAKESTKTIPIVMISSVDPVNAGYVQSFAHPGGNITGLAWLTRDLGAKRLELVREILPKASRVGVLWDADAPGPKVAFKEYSSAAAAFKLDLRSIEVRGANPPFADALNAAKNASTEALVVVANPLTAQHMKTILALATKYRLPSVVEEDRYVEAGGLISYGANLADLYRRAGEYVAEILKGGKPSEMRVRLASKFDLVVNLKTAKQLGISVPDHILVQADRVIR